MPLGVPCLKWLPLASRLSLHVGTSTHTVKAGLRGESKINNNEEVFPSYLSTHVIGYVIALHVGVPDTCLLKWLL